jgi:hypothetical protein
MCPVVNFLNEPGVVNLAHPVAGSLTLSSKGKTERKKRGVASLALFVWLINHQLVVFFSQNKLATNHQLAVIFSPLRTNQHRPPAKRKGRVHLE